MATIRKLGVLNASVFLGLFGIFLGIIISIIVAVLKVSGLSLEGFLGSWATIILFPLVYGVYMFISGLVFILLINLSLRIVNGIQLEMDLVEREPAIPMAAEQPVARVQTKNQNSNSQSKKDNSVMKNASMD